MALESSQVWFIFDYCNKDLGSKIYKNTGSILKSIRGLLGEHAWSIRSDLLRILIIN